MKVRSNYVSNSSSTSFCIVGVVATNDEFDVDSKNLRATLVADGCDEERVNNMDALEMINTMYNRFYGDAYKMFFDDISMEYGLGNYSSDDVIVGIDIRKMRNDETLDQFKDRVFKQLKGMGFTGNRESISIHVDGGYDG
jgi:hypothetical protein